MHVFGDALCRSLCWQTISFCRSFSFSGRFEAMKALKCALARGFLCSLITFWSMRNHSLKNYVYQVCKLITSIERDSLLFGWLGFNLQSAPEFRNAFTFELYASLANEIGSHFFQKYQSIFLYESLSFCVCLSHTFWVCVFYQVNSETQHPFQCNKLKNWINVNSCKWPGTGFRERKCNILKAYCRPKSNQTDLTLMLHKFNDNHILLGSNQ